MSQRENAYWITFLISREAADYLVLSSANLPGGGWILVAAELQRDLEVVGGEVVEVLHAAGHTVPGGAVCNAA